MREVPSSVADVGFTSNWLFTSASHAASCCCASTCNRPAALSMVVDALPGKDSRNVHQQSGGSGQAFTVPTSCASVSTLGHLVSNQLDHVNVPVAAKIDTNQ